MDKIIPIVSTLFGLVEKLWQYASTERDRLQQTGEWTPEQEQAFLDLQNQRNTMPWQKPMDPVATTNETPAPGPIVEGGTPPAAP